MKLGGVNPAVVIDSIGGFAVSDLLILLAVTLTLL